MQIWIILWPLLVSALLGGVVHSATRRIVGRSADAYPGGAFVVGLATGLLFSTWWACLLAALVGHRISVWLWTRASASPPPKVK